MSCSIDFLPDYFLTNTVDGPSFNAGETSELGGPIHQSSSETTLPAPRPYFEKLKSLRNEVYRHSALAMLWPSNKIDRYIAFVEESTLLDQRSGQRGYSGLNLPEADLLEHADQIGSYDRFTFIRYPNPELIQVLQKLQTTIRAVCQNIERLKKDGFCQSKISFLSVEQTRPFVAGLVSVHIDDITDLAQQFDNAIHLTQREPLTSPLRSNSGVSILTEACDKLLVSANLAETPSHADAVDYYKDEEDFARCWSNAVRVLDLAVLLYAGAHLDPFPALLLQETERQETDGDSHPSHSYLSGIQVQARSLKCLSPIFKDQKVWVFHNSRTALNDELYISANPDDLADIWGPMWRVQDKDNNVVLQYNIGNGALVPWRQEVVQGHPRPNVGERLVHWMPYTLTLKALQANATQSFRQDDEHAWDDQMLEDQDSSESEPDDQIDSTEATPGWHSSWVDYAREHPFSGNEKLLIGAQKSFRFERSECHCSTRRTTHNLKERRCLHYLETSRLFHYVDTRNINMSIGSHGLTLGASLGIKAQSGRSWKEVLLEAWENQPSTCNPKILESFWGVVVSLCNQNARRVRLVELLGTDSVWNLLRPFRWSDDNIKDQFYEAVTSCNPRALSAIWSANEQWREELGKALLACLRALCQTGYDSRREEFNVLWMSTKSAAAKRVVLKPSKHNWVRILQDSEGSLATAVMVKEWMGSRSVNELEGCRHREGQHIPTRLETALTINQNLKNLTLQRKRFHQEEASEDWRTADRLWKTGWDVSCVQQGDEFWIMFPDGRLRTVERLSPSHLLLKWDLVKRDEFRQLLGLNPGERFGHWEYTDEEDPPPVRPIPVHIQADK